ncbi:MAG: hypothetical protein B9S26_04440 [Opitutia bacterium Tous-C4FEB]|nr:MAG: hypothetical protein B9S26_04440 [Opitutae bacterium Tous-C4FEB]
MKQKGTAASRIPLDSYLVKNMRKPNTGQIADENVSLRRLRQPGSPITSSAGFLHFFPAIRDRIEGPTRVGAANRLLPECRYKDVDGSSERLTPEVKPVHRLYPG